LDRCSCAERDDDFLSRGAEAIGSNRVLYKDVAQHASTLTSTLEEASLRQANAFGSQKFVSELTSHKQGGHRPRNRCPGPIKNGLICVLRSTILGGTYRPQELPHQKAGDSFSGRKCVHLTITQFQPLYRLQCMPRIQTWVPGSPATSVSRSASGGLARQMNQGWFALLPAVTIPSPGWNDPSSTQALFTRITGQTGRTARRLAATLNPVHDDMFASIPPALLA